MWEVPPPTSATPPAPSRSGGGCARAAAVWPRSRAGIGTPTTRSIRRFCSACGGGAKAGKCVFGGTVNEFAEKAKEADGFVFGTPVHYAAASGNMTAFLDRLFYSAPKETFCRKPAAVVTSARRAGTTAAYEQLLKYPGIMEMPIVSSCYWNNVHGSCPEDVQKDEEGLRTMRVLGRNMAWLLRCIDAGTAAGVPAPRQEPMARTNFIR